MQPDILIYDDYVFNHGILYRGLCDYFGRERIGFCDADDIVRGCLNKNIYLFVMPGGADLYYCEKLNGQGNKNILSYVENGGNYLGICAGAYYACRAIEWGKDTEQEIIGPRELNFIDCLAVGPVYDFIQDKDINNSWNNAVNLEFNDGKSSFRVTSTYSGGPVFTDIKDDANVLGHFSDLPAPNAAALEQKVGKGKVVLTSTHPEMNKVSFEKSLYKNNNFFYDYNQNVLGSLNTQTSSFLPFLLDRFNVPAA